MKAGTYIGTVSTIVDLEIEPSSAEPNTEWDYHRINKEILLTNLSQREVSQVHEMLSTVLEVLGDNKVCQAHVTTQHYIHLYDRTPI